MVLMLSKSYACQSCPVRISALVYLRKHRRPILQANYTLSASVAASAVGGVVDLSGSISVHKTTVKEAVASDADFVVAGGCKDFAVTDFGGTKGASCDNKTVACETAQVGTSPFDGTRIDARHACCKCGGGVKSEEYAIGGRCKFNYAISGTVGFTTSVRVIG